MANLRWIKHVRAYAKKHNITYMCAISKASATYKKTKRTKPKPVKKTKPKPVKKTKKNADVKTGILLGLYNTEKNKWRITAYLKPEKRTERKNGRTAYISHHTGTLKEVEKIAKKELKNKYKQIQKEFNIVSLNKLDIKIKNMTTAIVYSQVSIGKTNPKQVKKTSKKLEKINKELKKEEELKKKLKKAAASIGFNYIY